VEALCLRDLEALHVSTRALQKGDDAESGCWQPGGQDLCSERCFCNSQFSCHVTYLPVSSTMVRIGLSQVGVVPGATEGVIVAGGHGNESRLCELHDPNASG